MGISSCDLCQDQGCYELAEKYKYLYKKEKDEVRRYRKLLIKLKHKILSGEGNIDDELLNFNI